VKVNEIFSTGSPDWVEFFNPSGLAVTFSGVGVADEALSYVSIPTINPNTPVTIPPRGFYRMTASGSTTTAVNLGFGLGGSDGVFIRSGGVISVSNASTGTSAVLLTSAVLPPDFGIGVTMLGAQVSSITGQTIALTANANANITAATLTSYIGLTGAGDDFRYQSGQINPNTVGRVWDGGARSKDYDFGPDNRFECNGSLYRGVAGPHPVSDTTTNHTQAPGPVKFIQATHNPVTQTGIFLHYANLGEEPAAWRYSPKQQDFHPISVEALAVRTNNEFIVGLRSPLVNRTTGHAYAFVFSNAGNQFLPAAGWTAGLSQGLQSVRQLNLNGQGKVRINKAGCLDRCEEGPVMVIYPQGTWYTYVDKEDIDEIIDQHIVDGKVVGCGDGWVDGTVEGCLVG
jgi:(2Fe-2S) ferredoxin